MSTKKEVVKKQATEIMVGDLGSLEDFAGQGIENIGIEDVKLPFIKLYIPIVTSFVPSTVFKSERKKESKSRNCNFPLFT